MHLGFQVFLIMHQTQLVQQLAEVIFHGDISLAQTEGAPNAPKAVSLRVFMCVCVCVCVCAVCVCECYI